MSEIRAGFLGHVDSGKSTLCGHLLYKMGWIDPREFDKINRKADEDKMTGWKWARILDIYEEEQKKGKTHESMEVDFEYKDTNIVLVDNPGHRSFSREAIKGITNGNLDCGLVLISAIDNEFRASLKGGMLDEHIIFAKISKVKRLVILINKMDKVEWNKKIYDGIVNKITSKVNAKGFKEKHIIFIPISAYEGVGITDTCDMPDWYKGESFLDTLYNSMNIFEKDRKNKEEKEKKKVESNKFIAEMCALEKGTPISGGYKGLFYVNGKEIRGEITKIKDSPILHKDKMLMVGVQLDEPVELSVDSMIILRKNVKTVAIGKISKIMSV